MNAEPESTMFGFFKPKKSLFCRLTGIPSSFRDMIAMDDEARKKRELKKKQAKENEPK